MTELLDAALDYASRGYAVFPCGPDKAPHVRDGFKAASTGLEVVDQWWTTYPDALIGMPVPEGFVIVDVDPRNGGDKSLRELLNTHGRWGRTRVATTRGSGFHYWLRLKTEDGARFRKELAPGIDVKVPGKGYVIVPPSPGYAWKYDGDAADAPAWLVDLIVKPAGEQRVVVSDTAPRYSAWEDGTKYGLRARDAELARLATAAEGTRNDTLNRVAFSLGQLAAGGELKPDATIEQVYAVAERIGLDPEESDLTIRSGWEAGERDPRNAPERDEPQTPPKARVIAAPEASFWTRWDIDEPSPPFYLDPLLPVNGYVLVYGPTEAAKSIVWSAVLADGSRNGVKSSVYSLENPRPVDRDRLRRLSPDPSCFRMTHEPLDLGWQEQVEALVEREREWGTNVLLIDTYSHAFNSHQSDDGNARAIAFAQVVRHVMHELRDQGLTVVVIDHTGFPKEGDIKEPRDASAKRQQVDVAVYMEKEGEWQPGSNRAGFAMRNYKAARFANPFQVRGAILGRKGEPLTLHWEGADFASRWSS